MATDTINQRNRNNAQKSTGPKTAAGKAASSRNALKHGFTGTMIATKEDRNELCVLNRELCKEYQPETRLEGEAITKIVWAIHQGNRLRIQLCDTERLLIEQITDEATEPNALDTTKLAVVRDHTPSACKQLDLLRRYSRDADRDFDRSARTLVWLQSQRKKEDRLQQTWEREEERKQKNSHPDLYPSAYHSMTQTYLEQHRPPVTTDQQRQAEKLAKEKQYREELESYLDPLEADDNEPELEQEPTPNEPTQTPPKR